MHVYNQGILIVSVFDYEVILKHNEATAYCIIDGLVHTWFIFIHVALSLSEVTETRQYSTLNKT